jgi:Fic family protein
MKFPPVFSQTPEIRKLLYDLDVLRAGFELNPIPAGHEIILRRNAILKSSLYSARIEGNPLSLTDLADLSPEVKNWENTEVSNLIKAYGNLTEYEPLAVTPDIICELHRTALGNISGSAGFFRSDESIIYNQAGAATYLTPAPQDIRTLIDSLCGYINLTVDPVPVAAAVAHIWFEKIHPFLDGNGRVGRLISSLILKKGKYDFAGLVPFEEYLDIHRDEYYYHLGRDSQDVTDFIVFYISSILAQARISLRAASEPEKHDQYAHLLPRRAEIMRVIDDHQIISFDFLARRFRAVPPRTLHHDLSRLIKGGLVQKMGITRGVQYCIKGK